MLNLFYFSGSLFFIGMVAVVYNSHNIIRILIGIELCLLASNWNFLLGFVYLQILDGFSIVLILLAIAAAEVAIGFGLIIFGYRKTGTIDLERYNMLNDGVDPQNCKTKVNGFNA